MDRKFYSEKLFRVCLIMVMFISTAAFAQAPCTNTAISSFTPASAPAGTIITLSGNGFTLGAGTTSVKFNGVDAVYTVVSDTQITATLPTGNTSGTVSVVTNGCLASRAGFTVLSTNCTTAATDVYISELYDHTPGSYGVIELYNPSPTETITFDGDYVLERYGDVGGDSPSYTLILSGSIGPESTYLVLSYGTGALGCDVPTQATMGTGINENDEIKLRKNSVVIDIARAPNEIGYTVIRNPDALAPTTAYNANDWDFNSQQSCSDLGSHFADPVTAPPLTVTTQPADVNICANIATATFSVTATNAAGATYQWKTLDTNGNWVNASGAGYSGGTTPTLTVTTSAVLNNSQYYVVITTPACTAISNAAQLIINPLPEVTYVITDATCANPKGSITLTPTVGTGLTYNINGGAYQAGATFTDLDPGNYTISIKSDAGCTTTLAPLTVAAPPAAPVVAQAILTQPTCTLPTGTLEITAPTGTGFLYSFNGGDFQAETIYTGLVPDTYTIVVKNADGCTSAPATFVINVVPNAPASAEANLTQPTCAVITGAIEVTSPIGTGLLYSLNGGPFQAETTFEGLTPDSYTVTVKNADGCTSAPETFVINPVPAGPAIADVILTQPTCTTATGIITIQSPTDTGLQYRLNDNAYQTGTTFTGLTPGSYTVTVLTPEGCTSTSAPFIINTQPVVIPATAQVIQPTCTIATGRITLTAPLVPGYLYSLNGGPLHTTTDFIGLPEGSYTITVQTPEGCTSTSETFIINAQPATPAVATTAIQQPDCSSQAGTITVTAPTGTGFMYSISGGMYQESVIFTGLTEGNYVITVQNTDGCTSETPNIIINAPQGGQPELAGSQGCRPSMTGSSYILEALVANNSFDINNATFEWRVEGQNQVIGNENLFNVSQYSAEEGFTSNDFPLQFELTVITPGGCEDTLVYTIDGIFCDIPRGISPNNDTANDSFDLTGMNVSNLTIFNRYGLEVYKRDNYTNQWHGQTDNGKDLPNGTYFYVVKTTNTTRTGWVYVNRQN